MDDPLLPVAAAIARRPELTIDARITLDGVPTLIVSGPACQAVVRSWEEFEQRFPPKEQRAESRERRAVPSGRTKRTDFLTRNKQLELFA